MVDITESPTEFAGHFYEARRNAGEDRYQVFSDDMYAPVGYIEVTDNDRLEVFDQRSELLKVASTYHEALSLLATQWDGGEGER